MTYKRRDVCLNKHRIQPNKCHNCARVVDRNWIRRSNRSRDCARQMSSTCQKQTYLSLSRSLVHRQTWRLTGLLTIANGFPSAYQISTQSAQPLPRNRKRNIYGKGVRTCRCTPSMTCGRHLVNDPQPTYQI